MSETKTAIESIDSQQRAKSLKEWLRPAESSGNAQRARDKRHHGTGTWLLESDEFQKWLTGGRQHLCLYGLGGCGKTVLSSTILDYLKKTQETPILYFFFDFNDSQKGTVSALVRSLIFQLYLLGESWASEIEALQKAHDNGKDSPSTQDLLDFFQSTLERVPAIVILVDALDECKQEDQEQEKLIRWMIELVSAPTLRHVKIVATTRPEAAFVDREGYVRSDRKHRVRASQ